MQVGAATTWQTAGAGYGHTLALRQDGTLWAWGQNTNGQLGTGAASIDQPTPAQVGTDTSWRSLALGSAHTLALRQDGTLWSWGYNYFGQLGLGSTTDQSSPQPVGSATWQTIAAGYGHTLGLLPDGSLWTWGFNNYGQLGRNTATNPLPIYIPLGSVTLAAATSSPAATWQLAPNPAHTQATLLGIAAYPSLLYLFDSQGRLVRIFPTPLLGLEGLTPGLYLLRATVGSTTRTLRLTVE